MVMQSVETKPSAFMHLGIDATQKLSPITRLHNYRMVATAAVDQTIARRDEPLVRHRRHRATTDAVAALVVVEASA